MVLFTHCFNPHLQGVFVQILVQFCRELAFDSSNRFTVLEVFDIDVSAVSQKPQNISAAFSIHY
jgi:hypothetical protein